MMAQESQDYKTINKIYIPTIGRAEKQITVDNMPKKYWSNIYLVIIDSEKHLYQKYLDDGIKLLICREDGIAKVRKFIVDHAKLNNFKKIGMLDDDLKFVYQPNPENKVRTKIFFTNTYEAGFDNMFDLLSGWLDKYVFCGLDSCWNPPRIYDTQIAWRVCSNVFYNIDELPIDKITWDDLIVSEDYNVTLQLLTMGYPNIVSFRYKVYPTETQTKGGCSGYRSLQVHNACFNKLKMKFPDFVKLRLKIAKSSGKWSKQEKLAATIYWKKAYASSKKSEVKNGN